jgi:Ca2+-binding EF-hand superfamily protein
MNRVKTVSGWLGVIVAASVLMAQEAAPPATSYSTGVRSLATPSPDASNRMPNRSRAARGGNGPTLPGGKLPQYQFDHHRRELPAADTLADPRLRFLLALAERPLLIEATLTIDGLPFQMARELRIQQLLEDLKREPEPMPEAADSTPESPVQPAPEKTESETKTPDETKQPEEQGAAGEGKAEEEKAKVTPPTEPAYALPADVLERLRRQVKATGEPASVEELRWLLTNWIDGPSLLLLKDHFQQFRANQRPVFHILDRDRDGRVSADELAQAVKSFEECDLNRNDIVEATEIERSAKDPRRRPTRNNSAGRLIFLLPDQKTAAETYARLAEACASGADSPAEKPLVARFDANGDGQFDAAELKSLHEAIPDLRLTIAFDSQDATKSKLTVDIPQSHADRPFAAVSVLSGPARESAILLLVDGQPVEFSAVQNEPSDQVSVGAVNDGYPLLAEIDPNDDGRFTNRELRSLIPLLKKFDRDNDGALTRSETQATMRVCFGLGPIVHRELAELRRVNRGSQSPDTPGPDWFVRMDRNKDNDVSRKEFPGTDEQFQQLDADGDQLISAEEARDSSP